MDLSGFLETYKYILKFHPVKYLGIAVMILVPLFLIYRFVFLSSGTYELLIGIIASLVIGSLIWAFGWDPYG